MQLRLQQALALLDDIGCNIVRCWGGNVYESDEFFNFCDAHGIMVWQDFAMGCAVYPQEKLFMDQLEKEAVYHIKRLRNHAALALWAGRWQARNLSPSQMSAATTSVISSPQNRFATSSVVATI